MSTFARNEPTSEGRLAVNARSIARLACLSAALFVAPLATAQDVARNIVVPQSRVMILPDAQAPVSIESVDVSVTMRDRVAMTQMRITLANPSNRMQEAELLVPVPDGASATNALPVVCDRRRNIGHHHGRDRANINAHFHRRGAVQDVDLAVLKVLLKFAKAAVSLLG